MMNQNHACFVEYNCFLIFQKWRYLFLCILCSNWFEKLLTISMRTLVFFMNSQYNFIFFQPMRTFL